MSSSSVIHLPIGGSLWDTASGSSWDLAKTHVLLTPSTSDSVEQGPSLAGVQSSGNWLRSCNTSFLTLSQFFMCTLALCLLWRAAGAGLSLSSSLSSIWSYARNHSSSKHEKIFLFWVALYLQNEAEKTRFNHWWIWTLRGLICFWHDLLLWL